MYVWYGTQIVTKNLIMKLLCHHIYKFFKGLRLYTVYVRVEAGLKTPWKEIEARASIQTYTVDI